MIHPDSSFQYRNFLGLLADFSQGRVSRIRWDNQFLVMSKNDRPKGIVLKMLLVPFDEMTAEIKSFFQSTQRVRLEQFGPELILDDLTGSVYLSYLLPYPLTYLHLKKALADFDVSLKQWKEILLH